MEIPREHRFKNITMHTATHLLLTWYTRFDQKAPRMIFLLSCGYTLGHPCLQGGVLELPLPLGQGTVPARFSVLCELRSKRVV